MVPNSDKLMTDDQKTQSREDETIESSNVAGFDTGPFLTSDTDTRQSQVLSLIHI